MENVLSSPFHFCFILLQPYAVITGMPKMMADQRSKRLIFNNQTKGISHLHFQQCRTLRREYHRIIQTLITFYLAEVHQLLILQESTVNKLAHLHTKMLLSSLMQCLQNLNRPLNFHIKIHNQTCQ